jgi:hypothetical protein
LGRLIQLRLLSFSEKEKGYSPTLGATFGGAGWLDFWIFGLLDLWMVGFLDHDGFQ